MVRTPGFQCRGLGSIPGRGTEIPQAAWCDTKKPLWFSAATVSGTLGPCSGLGPPLTGSPPAVWLALSHLDLRKARQAHRPSLPAEGWQRTRRKGDDKGRGERGLPTCTQLWTRHSQPATQPHSPTSWWSPPPAWATHPEATAGSQREVQGPRGSLLPTPIPVPATAAPGQGHSLTPLRLTPTLRALREHRPPLPCLSSGRANLSSPFIPGLKFGQQGGPPPLGLDDGARRQV